METSINLADYYYSLLKSLSKETKLHLIKKLTDSLLEEKTTKKHADIDKLRSLFGAWSDEPDADELIEEIRKSRTSGVTRHIETLGE